MRANDKRCYKVEIFDGTQIYTEDSKFDLIYEMRRLVAGEAQECLEKEFTLDNEQRSFHLIGCGEFKTSSSFENLTFFQLVISPCQ